MGTERVLPPIDARLAALSGHQYGVVSRAQLIGLGLGPHGIALRVRTGRLHRMHRGVYAVGQAELRPEAYWLAAVLACGPGAVLSHRSGAALWEIRFTQATLVDVTVPSR